MGGWCCACFSILGLGFYVGRVMDMVMGYESDLLVNYTNCNVCASLKYANFPINHPLFVPH